MRFMGADLLDPSSDSAPQLGRATVQLLENGDVQVRFVDASGHLLEHRLSDTSPDARTILAGARSTVVLVASHREDLGRAEGAGSFQGWVRVAQSDESDDREVGYAIGVGVQS